MRVQHSYGRLEENQWDEPADRTIRRGKPAHSGVPSIPPPLRIPPGASMNSKQKKLYRKAVAKHEKIYPCKSKKSFQECFTISGDKLLFWYNTEDNSTHVQAEED
jgi:hypothetical protein